MQILEVLVAEVRRDHPHHPGRRLRCCFVINHPEYKERHNKGVKEAWKRPEVRARHKEARKKTWKDPEVRARHKDAMNDPGVTARHKDAMNDPEVKKLIYEKKWIARDREMIKRLRKWKEKHGHVHVPQSEPDLGTWLKKKRENMRAGRWLHPEVENALRELGVVGDILNKELLGERGDHTRS